jgi:hypothetical protein
LATIFIFSATAATAAPIWEEHTKLLCRAGTSFDCHDNNGGCDRATAEYVMQFDFVAGTAKSVAAAKADKILAKVYVDPSADTSVIFLGFGDTVTFFKPRPAQQPDVADEIPAVEQTASVPYLGALTTFMTCYPA